METPISQGRNLSVEDINNKALPWLTDYYRHSIEIWGGERFGTVIGKLKREEVDIFYPKEVWKNRR